MNVASPDGEVGTLREESLHLALIEIAIDLSPRTLRGSRRGQRCGPGLFHKKLRADMYSGSLGLVEDVKLNPRDVWSERFSAVVSKA